MPSPSVAVSSLRAYILNALSVIPGSRTFHIHVLTSIPRKPGQSLFLYADTRPKCLVQDVLVLLSEESPKATENDHSSPNPRIFVSALEASVYAFPASGSTILYVSKVDGTGQGAFPSPTSTLVRAFLLFYASPQSPLYESRTSHHHLWIHLFARSQRQYLFPNSADHPSKRPLGDVALCKWWKKMLGDVAKAVEVKEDVEVASDADTVVQTGTSQRIFLYHILPGQTELEASYLLRDAQGSSTLPRTPWNYTHPYQIYIEAKIPFPSGTTAEPPKEVGDIPPLAYLIPHFEDDPKSRFLDELSATSEEQAVAIPIPTPRTKRRRTSNGTESWDSILGSEGASEAAPERGPSIVKHGDGTRIDFDTAKTKLEEPPAAPAIMYIPPSSSPPHAGSPSPPPRPSTPEIVGTSTNTNPSPQTPNLPTFPASLLSPHTPMPNTRGSARSPQNHTPHTLNHTPQTPRTPRRPKSDLDTIASVEFWERMSFRQECALGAVTGFFVAIFSHIPQNGRTDISPPISSGPTFDGNNTANTELPSTLLSTGTIPHPVMKRVMSSLLTGVEFSTAERALKGTHVMETAIAGLCQGLGGSESYSEGSARKNSEHDAAGTENTASGMTPNIYTSHVYAYTSTSNPSLVRRAGDAPGVGGTPAINVLGVRRKKKRE